MRLLIDDHGYEWQDAWDICTQTFAYTNHTILAEALETWPISTMQTLLNRVVLTYSFLESEETDILVLMNHPTILKTRLTA